MMFIQIILILLQILEPRIYVVNAYEIESKKLNLYFGSYAEIPCQKMLNQKWVNEKRAGSVHKLNEQKVEENYQNAFRLEKDGEARVRDSNFELLTIGIVTANGIVFHPNFEVSRKKSWAGRDRRRFLSLKEHIDSFLEFMVFDIWYIWKSMKHKCLNF